MAFALCAMLAAAAPGSLSAQQQDYPESEIMTTVYGTPPADLSGFPEGPEVEATRS
jgi:hypothetical protein